MRNTSIRIWNGQEWLTGTEIRAILKSIINLTDHTFDIMADRLPEGLVMSLCTNGQRDKNGKCIYEGDIIRYFFGLETDEEGMKDPSRYRTTMVEWDRDAFGFYPFNQFDEETDEWVVRRTVEIIGNCHENPELLDGIV